MITETQLWNLMMDGKEAGTWPFPQAFATLKRPIVMKKWSPNRIDPKNSVSLPAGFKVRVVMASRFGDVGITDDLNATSGYHYRTTCVAGELQGPQGPIKLEPADLLENIELIERAK